MRMLSRLALWPAAGLALLALGWWEMRHGTGWGALVAAAAAAPSPKRRGSRERRCRPAAICGFSPAATRSSLAIPFALGGVWTAYLLAMLAYAAMSFFIVQQVRHLLPS